MLKSHTNKTFFIVWILAYVSDAVSALYFCFYYVWLYGISYVRHFNINQSWLV